MKISWILKQVKDKVIEKKTEGVKVTREAPFYKIIENTNLAVDGFCYGDLKHVKYYLLSHFHSDHYQGEHYLLPSQLSH